MEPEHLDGPQRRQEKPNTMKLYTNAMGHCMAGEISWLSPMTETTSTP